MVAPTARLLLIALVAFVAMTSANASAQTSYTAANDHTVLILKESVYHFAGAQYSFEAQAALALGYDIRIVDRDQWPNITASEFASYRAIILGDPQCNRRGTSTTYFDAAVANRATWGPELDGNVVIVGSDPSFHAEFGDETVAPSALAMVTKSLAFVLSVPNSNGKTGAYIALGCLYENTTGALPLLDYVGNGGFSVRPAVADPSASNVKYDNAHITSFHPALGTLTDATLSNWQYSIHEVFTDWDETNFEVLAMADGFGDSYTDDDGTVGSPYILARGVCASMPSLSVRLTKRKLNASGRLIDIAASVTSTGNNIAVTLHSITSDEGDEVNDVAGATTGAADYAFQLRAQRDNDGDGRVYTVTYRAVDACGNATLASRTVTVRNTNNGGGNDSESDSDDSDSDNHNDCDDEDDDNDNNVR